MLDEKYFDYLRSDAWQQRRKRVLARSGGRCERCGIYSIRLDVHHVSYQRFGAEPLEDLQVLCRPCHDAAHTEREAARRVKAVITFATKKYGDSALAEHDWETLEEAFDAWLEAKAGAASPGFKSFN